MSIKKNNHLSFLYIALYIYSISAWTQVRDHFLNNSIPNIHQIFQTFIKTPQAKCFDAYNNIAPDEIPPHFQEFLPLLKDLSPIGPPISEVMELANHSYLSPEVVQNYDLRRVAKSLVRRHYYANANANKNYPIEQNPDTNNIESGDEDKSPFSYWNDTQIHLAFHEKDLDKIIQSGSFLNQHQTLNSRGGLFMPGFRSFIEDWFLKIKIKRKENETVLASDKINFIRPKYAHLYVPKNKKGVRHLSRTNNYGRWTAVLFQGLKYRSTFSEGDSLNAVRSSEEIFTFYPNPFPKKPYPNVVYESQVWGPINIEEDVDYFMVPSDYPFQEALGKLKLGRIPVFSVKENSGYIELDRILHSGIEGSDQSLDRVEAYRYIRAWRNLLIQQ